MPYLCPNSEEPPFPGGRFDALAVCLLEDLGAQEVGAVRATLKAKDSSEDVEVSLSGLVILI